MDRNLDRFINGAAHHPRVAVQVLLCLRRRGVDARQNDVDDLLGYVAGEGVASTVDVEVHRPGEQFGEEVAVHGWDLSRFDGVVEPPAGGGEPSVVDSPNRLIEIGVPGSRDGG